MNGHGSSFYKPRKDLLSIYDQLSAPNTTSTTKKYVGGVNILVASMCSHILNFQANGSSIIIADAPSIRNYVRPGGEECYSMCSHTLNLQGSSFFLFL